MRAKDPLKIIDEELTAKLKEIQAKTLMQACLLSGENLSLHEFHGVIGGKNNSYVDSINSKFLDFNDFFAKWIKGLTETYQEEHSWMMKYYGEIKYEKASFRNVRSAHEVDLWLATNKVDLEIRDSLKKFRDKVYSTGASGSTTKTMSSHPGTLLNHQFIKPSGIARCDWQHALCISSRNTFANILAGKTEISLKLMVKICRVFRIELSHWIEMQNQFYSLKIDQAGKKMSRKPGKILIEADVQNPRHPFQLLVDGYLKPMGISVPQFMKHIGVNVKRFDHSKRGRKKIDFDLAIRIGQALETGPLYWVNLQLEFDVHNYEKGIGGRSFHLH